MFQAEGTAMGVVEAAVGVDTRGRSCFVESFRWQRVFLAGVFVTELSQGMSGRGRSRGRDWELVSGFRATAAA